MTRSPGALGYSHRRPAGINLFAPGVICPDGRHFLLFIASSGVGTGSDNVEACTSDPTERYPFSGNVARFLCGPDNESGLVSVEPADDFVVHVINGGHAPDGSAVDGN